MEGQECCHTQPAGQAAHRFEDVDTGDCKVFAALNPATGQGKQHAGEETDRHVDEQRPEDDRLDAHQVVRGNARQLTHVYNQQELADEGRNVDQEQEFDVFQQCIGQSVPAADQQGTETDPEEPRAEEDADADVIALEGGDEFAKEQRLDCDGEQSIGEDQQATSEFHRSSPKTSA